MAFLHNFLFQSFIGIHILWLRWNTLFPPITVPIVEKHGPVIRPVMAEYRHSHGIGHWLCQRCAFHCLRGFLIGDPHQLHQQVLHQFAEAILVEDDLTILIFEHKSISHHSISLRFLTCILGMGIVPSSHLIQQGSVALHQLQMGAQRFKSALHRLGGQLPVCGNFGGQLREALLPQSCQQFRRQLSLQQSAVQSVLRLGSGKSDIQIQLALTPVPDGHVDRAGAVTVGQLLPLTVFEQIKGCDL